MYILRQTVSCVLRYTLAPIWALIVCSRGQLSTLPARICSRLPWSYAHRSRARSYPDGKDIPIQ